MTNIVLNISKARISSSRCCVQTCNAQYPEKFHRLSKEMRHEIMKSNRVYIPENARACQLHCDLSIWQEIQVQNEDCIFTKVQIEEMVDLLRFSPKRSTQSVLNKKSDFEFKTETGLTRGQFENLFQQLPSMSQVFAYDKNNETAVNSLYLYLMKLRTARTHDDIGLAFGITRFTVTERMKKVRKVLEQDFVFKHVNYERTREELAAKTSLLSQTLFCGGDTTCPVLVVDGTYVYVQKSSNYEFQKKSYSDQKKRNFVRVMVCTTTDGTVVFVLGPFPASTNDASVMSSLVQHSNVFSSLVQGDVLLVDRGFRDCLQLLTNMGLNVKMPHLINKSDNKKQFSTEQANQTRLVTANRYGVETRNGHFKTFKIFAKEWANNTLSVMMTDFRIAAALVNVYFKSIESHESRSAEIATKMLSRLQMPNRLSDIVRKNTFQKNVKKFEQFYDFHTLPQLSIADMIQIALGTYQIKQAPSYCHMHYKANNSEFVVYECPDAVAKEMLAEIILNDKKSKLLMMRVKSRFRSNVSHDVYILIDMMGSRENCVLEYCCSCQNGLRTVGTCSHVMSLIWFSLFAKNAVTMFKPAEFLDNYFVEEFSSDEDYEEEEE